jgi:hypothetical protein
MNAVIGRFIGGKIELVTPAPADWREGQSVIVEPNNENDDVMLEQGDDPESIERWIQALDNLPPSAWTDADEERWQKARAEQKAFEFSKWEENAAKLKAMFE